MQSEREGVRVKELGEVEEEWWNGKGKERASERLNQAEEGECNRWLREGESLLMKGRGNRGESGMDEFTRERGNRKGESVSNWASDNRRVMGEAGRGRAKTMSEKLKKRKHETKHIWKRREKRDKESAKWQEKKKKRVCDDEREEWKGERKK